MTRPTFCANCIRDASEGATELLPSPFGDRTYYLCRDCRADHADHARYSFGEKPDRLSSYAQRSVDKKRKE